MVNIGTNNELRATWDFGRRFPRTLLTPQGGESENAQAEGCGITRSHPPQMRNSFEVLFSFKKLTWLWHSALQHIHICLH